jgi:hypothetical protein
MMMAINPVPRNVPDTRRVKVDELSSEEKDRLLQEIVDHLGREIETMKWDGDEHRSISLVHKRF